ncbi:MAG: hypothetical protein WA985_08415, partial [Erythrobacter sp.]
AGVDKRHEQIDLTPHVRSENRKWQQRLLHYLEDRAGDDYVFPSGNFVKDYRFVHGMSVYFGSQLLDLNEALGLKTALKLAPKAPLLAVRSFADRCFRYHLEARHLKGFSPEGFDEFYLQVADLLELHPGSAGLVATSWYHDPALAQISPRLAYLLNGPVEGGAHIVKHKSTAFDVESATAKSKTRRVLYESGEYLPVAYTWVWPREALIEWARRKRDISRPGS